MTFSFNLIDSGADGSLGQDGRVVRSYWGEYLYKDNSSSRPSGLQVATNIGILPGSIFADDVSATCHSFSLSHPTKVRPPYYRAKVRYVWATNAPLNVSTSVDPTSRRTIWSAKPLIQQRNVIKYPVLTSSGITDEPILNTAGQYFDGGIPVNVRLGQITASRNVDATGYDIGIVNAYSGAVNKYAYLNGSPGTVQVDVESHEKYEAAFHYFEELWTFTYDAQGHQPNPASAGFYQTSSVSSGSSGSASPSDDLSGLKRITIDGKPVMEPEPLDEDGYVVPIENRPEDCAFVEVPYFQEIDFATQFGL